MGYDSSPYIYVSTGGDDSVAIKALVENGERWIQSASVNLVFDTPMVMTQGGLPAHGFRFEPAPGMDKVVINVDGIGRDPIEPTTPSYAGFEYNGGFAEAGYLAAAAAVGELQLTVNDGELYTVGQWVFISDASTDPDVTLLPLDGPMETRQILAIDEDVLTINEALDRDHVEDTIVATCVPIDKLFFRNLEFTGNAGNGIHAHASHGGFFGNISTDGDWRGGTMLLVDNAGIGNLIEDCYCTGNTPGLGSAEQVWGVAIEGQKWTRVHNSGGQFCGIGFAANYCIDCLIVEPRAQRCNVNVGIYTASIRTNAIRPFVGSPNNQNIVVTPDCIECSIVDQQAYYEIASTDVQEWRDYPTSNAVLPTDTFLVAEESGAGKQISKSTVVCRESDKKVLQDTFWSKASANFGPTYVAENSLQIWGWGMSGAPGAKNWVLINATLGDSLAISVNYSNNEVSLLGNLALASGKVYKVNGTQVVGGQGAAVANLTVIATTGSLPTPNGSVTIADAASPTPAELLKYCVELEATVETLLSRLRAHGLIAT